MINTTGTWTIVSSAGGNIQGHSPAVDQREFCDAVREGINILEIATLPSVARDNKNVVKACGKSAPMT